MARIGVDYSTVKQAAIKLLSQGINPSVQKIRDLLGTGSNTTIAEHLSQWREEYAQKTVHHLPTTMPKELISAVEVLWQAAMTQSEQQLIHYKVELDAQHEKIQQEQLQNQQQVEHIKQQLAQTINQLAEKNTACHALQTDCAVIKHQLEQKDQQVGAIQHQFEARLQRAYQEKDDLAERNQQLLQEIKSLQEQYNVQIKTHQAELQEARMQQEKSENRWLMLIDQARQETKETHKKLDTLRHEKDTVIEMIKNDLVQEKQQSIEIRAKLSLSLKTISELETKLSTNKSGKEIIDITTSVERGRKLNGKNISDKRLLKKFKFIDIKKSKQMKWGNDCIVYEMINEPLLFVIHENIPPGNKDEMHYHSMSKQFLYLLSGEITVQLTEKSIKLKQYQGILLSEKESHCVVNHGQNIAILLTMSVPGEINDRVLV